MKTRIPGMEFISNPTQSMTQIIIKRAGRSRAGTRLRPECIQND